MGRETGSLHLLAPLLLTGGKGADLVIRGNVVLNSPNSKPKRGARAIVFKPGHSGPARPGPSFRSQQRVAGLDDRNHAVQTLTSLLLCTATTPSLTQSVSATLQA
jgi:hypothetical protein